MANLCALGKFIWKRLPIQDRVVDYGVEVNEPALEDRPGDRL